MLVLTLIYIAILRPIVEAAPEYDCNLRTNIFKARGPSNFNNYYYIPNTFMIAPPCVSVSEPQYAQMVKSTIKCVGEHCRRDTDTWSCNDTRDCYEITHIIPRYNDIPTLKGCEVNIAGNMIMSYGLWNDETVHGYLAEKRIVFGAIMIQAYINMYTCCHYMPPNDVSMHMCEHDNSYVYIINIVGLSLIFCAMMAYIGITIYAHLRTDDHKMLNDGNAVEYGTQL